MDKTNEQTVYVLSGELIIDTAAGEIKFALKADRDVKRLGVAKVLDIKGLPTPMPFPEEIKLIEIDLTTVELTVDNDENQKEFDFNAEDELD